MKNKYQNIELADLQTVTQMQDAIERIEGEMENHHGGWKAWDSGYPVEMKAGAKRKIEAIERKIEKQNP